MAARPRITFDTNAANLVADPDAYSTIAPPGTGERLRQVIEAGGIKPFVSEASVFVECLGFPEKLAYLSVAGTPDPRPLPDPRRIAIFSTLERLGVRMLHAPLIGGEIFIEDLKWADDEVFSQEERLKRFGDFAQPYPRYRPLKELGNEKLKNQPPAPRSGVRQPWAVALKREWDQGDEQAKRGLRKQVEPIIGEWCDVSILASHVAYGNDVFCTTDRGKGAGSGSLLHHSNRAGLAAKGITIMSPEDVVARYPV